MTDQGSVSQRLGYCDGVVVDFIERIGRLLSPDQPCSKYLEFWRVLSPRLIKERHVRKPVTCDFR